MGQVIENLMYSKENRLHDNNLEQFHATQRQAEKAAHDVLTPLAALQEFITLVLDGVAGPIADKQGKYLAYARGACDQIRLATDQLIADTRVAAEPAEQIETQELAATVAEAWSYLASASGVEDLQLSIDSSARNKLVAADFMQFRGLLYTLLQDLVCYALPGESIYVSAQVTSNGEGDELSLCLASAASAQRLDTPARSLVNHRQIGSWLVSQSLGRDLRYQFELPIVRQDKQKLAIAQSEE